MRVPVQDAQAAHEGGESFSWDWKRQRREREKISTSVLCDRLSSHFLWQDVMCNVDRICELIKGTKQVSFFPASPHSTVAQFPADKSHLVLLQHGKTRRNKLPLQDNTFVCLTRNSCMFAGPSRHGPHHLPRVLYSRNHVRQGDIASSFPSKFHACMCPLFLGFALGSCCAPSPLTCSIDSGMTRHEVRTNSMPRASMCAAFAGFGPVLHH
jgi:hypothetical protein